MKGYKVFNPDWTCRGFQYEVGQTYEQKQRPSVCNTGFHFCKKAKDCFNYYTFDTDNKVAEVIAIGAVSEEGDKCSTNKIQIIREVSWEEVLTLVNTGKGNTGLGNNGHSNSGHSNSGHSNSGHRNSGHSNSGHCNVGYQNSGDWNQGNFCTGDFNITDHETGCFCTEEHKIRFFDQESEMTFSDWRNSEACRILGRIPDKHTEWIDAEDMTDEEKTDRPEYKTTGGYLRIRDNKDCRIEWWNGLSKNKKQVIMNIPNFDAKKFKKIIGIEVE